MRVVFQVRDSANDPRFRIRLFSTYAAMESWKTGGPILCANPDCGVVHTTFSTLTYTVNFNISDYDSYLTAPSPYYAIENLNSDSIFDFAYSAQFEGLDCTVHHTCDTCNAITGCGWCPTSGGCVPGLSAPKDSCPTYTKQTCNISCSTYDNCAACGHDARCGFCASTGNCTEGTAAGPAEGSCPAEQWHYEAANCPASLCAFSECAACQAKPGCGWCDSSKACLVGLVDGPVSATCPSSWYAGKTCPSVCLSKHTCHECTAVGCGFCHGLNSTCFPGTEAGPDAAYGTCQAKYWYTSRCPETCPGGGCDSCTSQNNCGYCESDKHCYYGSSAGPEFTTCARWTFSNMGCGPSIPGIIIGAVIGTLVGIGVIVVLVLLCIYWAHKRAHRIVASQHPQPSTVRTVGTVPPRDMREPLLTGPGESNEPYTSAL